jgi:hypothetical protein
MMKRAGVGWGLYGERRRKRMVDSKQQMKIGCGLYLDGSGDLSVALFFVVEIPICSFDTSADRLPFACPISFPRGIPVAHRSLITRLSYLSPSESFSWKTDDERSYILQIPTHRALPLVASSLLIAHPFITLHTHHPLTPSSLHSDHSLPPHTHKPNPHTQYNIRILLMSGQSKTFSFPPHTSVGVVKELVWGEWPGGKWMRSLSGCQERESTDSMVRGRRD